MTTRYAATLAYDGTDYQGFQRQPAPAPTIQRSVESAIEAVTGQPATVLAAGRTDAGVHASGQVIAFDVSWRHAEADLMRAINARLPLDIAIQSLWTAPDFHPRFDALWRQYAYRVISRRVRHPLASRYAWQILGKRLDFSAMNDAAALCLGERDFAAFGRPTQEGSTNTWREVLQSRWQMENSDLGEGYVYRVRATAFLYHMVRRMVGLMLQAGQGIIDLPAFADILRSRDISRVKALAPPNGLTLEAVAYRPRAQRFAVPQAELATALELERVK